MDEKITAIRGDYADPYRVLQLMEKQIYIEHFLKWQEKYVISYVKSSNLLFLFLFPSRVMPSAI